MCSKVGAAHLIMSDWGVLNVKKKKILWGVGGADQ